MAKKKEDPLQLLSPLESTELGIAAGVIEVCINQPQLYLKNAAQQGLPYVFFNPHSHSHFFYKIDIHTTYMYKCSSPLYLVIRILLHTLTQAIMHTYITLEPQHVSSPAYVLLSSLHTYISKHNNHTNHTQIKHSPNSKDHIPWITTMECSRNSQNSSACSVRLRTKRRSRSR